MAKRLSRNCEITVFGGISSLWHFVSDIPNERAKARPFEQLEHGKIVGYYVRPARLEETLNIPGMKLSDECVIVAIPTNQVGVGVLRSVSKEETLIVPRGCVERL